ncbi:hypothetical protein CISG_01257 [Coccidioides immitis RMSCC 3703]|uniref:Uncharacterized protein n=1 Tax=Coccidioides immitis RMSCC 3703 TaxID=454286 RepID=A0A0J8QUF3_COCIT|nr:hypothetical protein CISG_01257 [Coccidioides immitis RMSCC 3703]
MSSISRNIEYLLGVLRLQRKEGAYASTQNPVGKFNNNGEVTLFANDAVRSSLPSECEHGSRLIRVHIRAAVFSSSPMRCVPIQLEDYPQDLKKVGKREYIV